MATKIIIAGAGLGGLAAASCLMKAGYDVEIYEQAPELTEVGAGIQISANAFHVMRHLGVADELLRVGVRPGAYVFRLHDTGEELQRFSLSAEHEAQHGAPYVQLHRADLHDLRMLAGPRPARRHRALPGGEFEVEDDGESTRFGLHGSPILRTQPTFEAANVLRSRDFLAKLRAVHAFLNS